jgi:pimeloyl-ACP methyl ester carboxylesterase
MTLKVYENHQAETGKQIDLNIAVIPAVSRNPAPDPIFFLAGGPGEAATESFLVLLSAFQSINSQRDIVLVDQRGTGLSNPLDCIYEEPSADEQDNQAAVKNACKIYPGIRSFTPLYRHG